MTRSKVLLQLTLITGLAFTASVSSADEDSKATSYFKKYFKFHGYLSLGYADSNIEGERRLTGNEEILGIPEGGTASYGNAAVLLRYTAPADQHTFILQLSGRELGDSPVSDVEDPIELDWLFYQYQPAEDTRIRVGRFPAPVGIFNEIRDVGVLLPFYRPSFLFYREGSIFSETVDGVGISQRFFSMSDWSLDADVYYGEFDIFEQSPGFDDGIGEASARDAVGVQFWLNTQVDGLRVGLGGQRWVVGSESRFNFEATTWKSWYASLDWDLARFVARAEYRKLETTSQRSPEVPLIVANTQNYYFQFGWRVNEKLSSYLQPEFADTEQFSEFFVDGGYAYRDRRDVGFSVVYQLKPSIVFKAEYHEVEEELPTATSFVLGPSGPRAFREIETFESDYSILSVSLSF